jgi:hypothetical protein
MQRLLLSLILFFTLPAVPANPVIAKVHKTTHQIRLSGLMGGGGQCSATAIGPHALLTAAHCHAVTDTISVDGKNKDILGIIGDGLDHDIYLLGGDAFAAYATVSSKKQEQGDAVFILGNPAGFSDMYRSGTISGFEKNDDDDDMLEMLTDFLKKESGKKPEAKRKTPRITYYDLNGFFGDSGSAIFDQDGNISAVMSFVTGGSSQGFSSKYMGSYELRFSPERLKEAREFGTGK